VAASWDGSKERYDPCFEHLGKGKEFVGRQRENDRNIERPIRVKEKRKEKKFCKHFENSIFASN
jgi:hypothetical protein